MPNMPDYKKINIENINSVISPASEKLELDEAVGAETFGVNLFTAHPGEQLPWGYHRHPNQEEILLVLSGEIEVDTPDELYHISENEGIFVPMNHKQCATAVGNTPARVIAIGAPKASDEAIIEERCEHCEEVTQHEPQIKGGHDNKTHILSCINCGTEHPIAGSKIE